jgi:hypothetical protein
LHSLNRIADIVHFDRNMLHSGGGASETLLAEERIPDLYKFNASVPATEENGLKATRD